MHSFLDQLSAICCKKAVIFLQLRQRLLYSTAIHSSDQIASVIAIFKAPRSFRYA